MARKIPWNPGHQLPSYGVHHIRLSVLCAYYEYHLLRESLHRDTFWKAHQIFPSGQNARDRSTVVNVNLESVNFMNLNEKAFLSNSNKKLS